MFSEAYFVFSIGNLEPLWEAEYPGCFTAPFTECSSSLQNTLHYTQVAGIICGQLTLGFLADRIGRKYGSILTASLMFIFGILMAASTGTSVQAQFVMFTIVQTFFGVGVGGEYPVASTSANERAESTEHLSHRRGETAVCVLSMQGWGNLANTVVIATLLAIFGQTGVEASLNPDSLNVIWRLSYAIGLIPLGFILFWRIFVLKESSIWKAKRKALKKRQQAKASKVHSWRKVNLMMRHYWHRNVGTAVCWFVWDFAFYGNKLFQGTFIKILNPNATVITTLWWTALNSGVAVVGYYFAAFTIDKTWMGRTRMQMMGFLMVGLLFLFSTIFYDTLTTPEYIKVFQFMYYFSSFWGQFGPNATTWLLPAELNPTEVRTTCHGLSAAVGKAGALVAGVVFGLTDNKNKFAISAACGLLGAFFTFLFIPNITGLDLHEGDVRWLAILDGKHGSYHGPAVNPKHLSIVERMIGYGKQYREPEVEKEKEEVEPEGDHHTTAEVVGGLIVFSLSEDGPGMDIIHEASMLTDDSRAMSAKESLQYL